jgi:hypothetical protein
MSIFKCKNDAKASAMRCRKRWGCPLECIRAAHKRVSTRSASCLSKRQTLTVSDCLWTPVLDSFAPARMLQQDTTRSGFPCTHYWVSE